MNIRKLNEDLLILQREGQRPRFGQRPGWHRVDWMKTRYGGVLIFLRGCAMPPTCSRRRTDVRIEAGPSLYDPVGDGRLVFYRNLWLAPDLLLYDRRRRVWLPMPRLFPPDESGWAFLCIHPEPVSPGRNILYFIRALDLFLLNPGRKATPGESA